MNEENNNIDVSFEDEDVSTPAFMPEDVIAPGNIIGSVEEDTISDTEGPTIIDTNSISEEQFDQGDDFQGPIIVNDKEESQIEESVPQAEKVVNTESFKNLERELDELKSEREKIENDIANLNKRKDELVVLIKNKQEELDYKKEVEVTTDRLKTYIKDLEVNPGAVRDALAALMNNMNN